MHISSLRIQNYKSLLDLEITEPNPFTVFVGPNGAGKSNIFEALEYLNFHQNINDFEVDSLFGHVSNFLNRNSKKKNIEFVCDIDGITRKLRRHYGFERKDLRFVLVDDESFKFNQSELDELQKQNPKLHQSVKQFFYNFSRIFIGNSKLVKLPFKDDSRLALDASNLEKVLKRILQDEQKREEITEWLQLLVPGFERITIHSDNISGIDTFLIYEQGTNKPFTKSLISDGTYNILALLAAVYQSDEPQFLCIEEPENGLNPKVSRELVQFFRSECEEKGHYIWLNTHSQTLVAELATKEIILVDKVNGATQIKQFKNANLYGLRMDEAWLTNALGGGLPW